jgi:hypothetical protein
MSSEVMVYHDEEAIYFEHKGKDSGIVRFRPSSRSRA